MAPAIGICCILASFIPRLYESIAGGILLITGSILVGFTFGAPA